MIGLSIMVAGAVISSKLSEKMENLGKENFTQKEVEDLLYKSISEAFIEAEQKESEMRVESSKKETKD